MYPFKEIEPKWQKKWEEAKIFEVRVDQSRPKFYVLDMFPYPSGSGLHVGHVEGYTASDIVARYKRCRGFNVLHPMGWDAFGLPAEQHAIETGIHPEETTRQAIANFRRQLKMLGFGYDWSREVSTCDPKYYKWTQYIFTLLHKRGLAYQKEMPVNWCPALRTVLANEEVVDGKSERGGHPVERRMMRQWMLKITAYSKKLLEDLGKNEWHERTKEGQRNWIGQSSGLLGHFKIKGRHENLEIFTTRPDTMFGVTFMVLAPEYPLVDVITTKDQRRAVQEYQRQTLSKLDVERQAGAEKIGVFTGAYAINPVNNQEVPIWVADYVLMSYGTGAIMAVPGHDARDFEFAQKYKLPVIRVIDPSTALGTGGGELPFEGDGVCVNSDFINGLARQEATNKMISFFEKKNIGKKSEQYKLRDWLFSRQRYWGEPFPVVHMEKSGTKVLPLAELPVTLPSLRDYEPTETGEPPLSKAGPRWLNYTDPKTGEKGRRETDTMPGYAGSSWYFLRFTDPHNENEICSRAAESYFMPVDLYIGGAEHTVGHLMYARFWQKVLHDEGLVSHEEPFKKLVHQGMILGEDGEKMSKSRGNVINPDDVVKDCGADSLRVYEMFMGPLERDKPWSQHGLIGAHKFLAKVWRLVHNTNGDFCVDDAQPSEHVLRLMHQTVKKVTYDIENLAFNTAVSQMMIFVNELLKTDARPRGVIKPFIQCLAPFAPHIAEEIWKKLGEPGFVSVAPWPAHDEDLARSKKVVIAVQVNGRTRAKLEFEADSAEEAVLAVAKEVPFVKRLLGEGQHIGKVIFVKNRILNLIISPN